MNTPDYGKRSAKSSMEAHRPKASPAASAFLAVVAIGFGLLTVFFYLRWSAATAQIAQLRAELNEMRQNPGRAAKAETQQLVERVSQLISLPEGEEPTVATVNDPERLKSQPFFLRAKRGDKVLIYTNAKKAFLYDPVDHKIIEVAPVTIGSPPAANP